MGLITRSLGSALLLLVLVTTAAQHVEPASAHQSGCHRWHSCPSDSGSYVCGDAGYSCDYPTYSTGSDDLDLDPVDPDYGPVDVGPDPLEDLYADQQADLDERAGRMSKRVDSANAAVRGVDGQIYRARARESSASRKLAAVQPRLRREERRADRFERRARHAEAREDRARGRWEDADRADQSARTAALTKVRGYQRTTRELRAARSRDWWVAAGLIAFALLVLAVPLLILPRFAFYAQRALTWSVSLVLVAVVAASALAVAPMEPLAMPPAPAAAVVATAEAEEPSATTTERKQVSEREADRARRARERADRYARRVRALRRTLSALRQTRSDANADAAAASKRRETLAGRAQRLVAKLAEMRSCDVRTDTYACILAGE